MTPVESLSDTLRDIHGLDVVPWWPLAVGWWYVIAFIIFIAIVTATSYWMMRYAPWLGWRRDAHRQLRALKKVLPGEDPREVASRLSELLRRIAMARSGRKTVAGLTGENWLHWLAQQDSSNFDWEGRGRVLLRAPYMPPAMAVERAELAALIRAAMRWIDATQPSRTGAWLATLRSLFSTVTRKGGSARV
jgi:hypothetical protein